MFDCWVAPTKTRKLIDFSKWISQLAACLNWGVMVWRTHCNGTDHRKIPNIQRSKNLCASQNSSGKICPTGGSFGSKKMATLRNSTGPEFVAIPSDPGMISETQAWAIPWLVESDRQCYLKIAASSDGIQKSEICQAEKETVRHQRCEVLEASHVGS